MPMRTLTTSDPKLAIREAGFLIDLSHENIVQLEGLIEDTSKRIIWLAFPWAEHGNLCSFIASRDWEIPERIFLLNILVNEEYRAAITDFGSARRIRHVETPPPPISAVSAPRNLPGGWKDAIPAAQLNTTGNGVTLTIGKYTVRWAAPELLNEDRESLACDIWSLGWIAYEVMFGCVPFHDVTKETAVMWRVLQGDLPCLTDNARMALIQALSTLMMQCWSLDPDRRPKAEDCVVALSWMPMIVPAPTGGVSRREARLREAELNMRLGRMYLDQSDYSSSRDCYTKAIAIFTKDKQIKQRATGIEALGNLRLFFGEFDEAMKCYSEALQIRMNIGDRGGRADALWGLAGVHRARNQSEEAAELYSEVLQIRTEIGDRGGKADALWGLARVHCARNEYDEAARLYTEDFQIRTDIGDSAGRADALWGLAEVHLKRKEYDEAAKLYSEDLQIRIDIGDRAGRASATWGLAEVHRLRAEYDEAVTLYSEVLQVRTDIEYTAGRADALWGLAEIHRIRAEYGEAMTLYSEALQIRVDIGDRVGRADALCGLAHVHQARDEYTKAVEIYSDALQISTDIGYKYGISMASEGLAGIIRNPLVPPRSPKVGDLPRLIS
ncbi:hypothetical protein FRB90_000340 [Tulasnella sp. 427]|nr:hypothetical protein FRB90_000340 [Tulasnella sp. 427]